MKLKFLFLVISIALVIFVLYKNEFEFKEIDTALSPNPTEITFNYPLCKLKRCIDSIFSSDINMSNMDDIYYKNMSVHTYSCNIGYNAVFINDSCKNDIIPISSKSVTLQSAHSVSPSYASLNLNQVHCRIQ